MGLLLGAMALGTGSVFAGWQPVWSDEFDGTSVNSTKWTYDIGNGQNGWGNNELQYYTSRPTNVFVAGGLLHIVARKEVPQYNGFDYTSAKLKTQGLFSKKYGRFEFRARLPQGQGYWPALWMMPRDSVYGGWAASGEIDVMENRGSTPTITGGTIHYGGSWPNNVYSGAEYVFPGGGVATDFHTYMLDWGTNYMKWYVDGVLYQTQTSWYSSGNPYPAPFDQPFYLIMNLAVGGNYGGNPDGTTVFPGEVQVDYVRVYDYVASAIPDAPTGLSATAGGTQVALSWSTAAGATNYNVKCSTTNGGPYTTIASTATTSYTNTGLANGTTYYYVVSAANSFGESSNSVQISVTTTVPSANLALNKLVAVSSAENAGLSGPNAVDGNTSTRWSSTFSDPQWIYVDLQATFNINRVRLNWEAAYGKSYQIQVSSNAVDWTTIYSTTTGAGGTNDVTGLSGLGRYVRMYGTVRGTQYGYSLYEFEVYGNLAVPTGLTATAGDQQVSLSWNVVPAATGYNLKRSTINGGPYTTIVSTAATSYTNTGIVNGTTYYYAVSQVNPLAESTNSVQVSATPVCTPPPAPTGGNSGPVCAGSTLNLTASTVPGATYTWAGPNGFSSSEQNPSIVSATTNASGIYGVRAAVGNCTSLVATTTAIVRQPPSAPAAGNNGPVWTGMTLNLTASTVSGATYNWTGPTGFTSTDQNPSIADATTNTAGIYDVTVTVGGCTSAAGTTIVTVNPPVVISIQSSGDTFIVTWLGGTLQSATNIIGPWFDVSEAVSPWPITPAAPQQFYRVKLQ
jgi:beta-glucanase (GH16 family)